jgi:hypothetical protein
MHHGGIPAKTGIRFFKKKDIKIASIRAQNLFSIMHRLASLPGPQLGLCPQTSPPAVAPLRRHGARKNLAFALYKRDIYILYELNNLI